MHGLFRATCLTALACCLGQGLDAAPPSRPSGKDKAPRAPRAAKPAKPPVTAWTLPPGAQRTFTGRMQALERRHGGRLGVVLLDASGRALLQHAPRERFPLCSTFKVLLAAAVLGRVDQGLDRLENRVPYGREQLLSYAPVTTARVGEGGMSVEDLCAAAVCDSDNTAANLLLERMGGPAGLTAWLRDAGDEVTRLDRLEPELNSNLSGDARDTTTSLAMAGTLRRCFVGGLLSPLSRDRLEVMMLGSRTGQGRLKAGFPPYWQLAHKSGSGDRGATNDVAVLRLPGRPPVFLAAYYSGSSRSLEEREAVLAAVGREVSELCTPMEPEGGVSWMTLPVGPQR